MTWTQPPFPAQRWTIEIDDDNATDVWIPNTFEAERLLANVIERAGLTAWSESTQWPAEDPRFGHCDTCGAPCDAAGCMRDREHAVALAQDETP